MGISFFVELNSCILKFQDSIPTIFITLKYKLIRICQYNRSKVQIGVGSTSATYWTSNTCIKICTV